MTEDCFREFVALSYGPLTPEEFHDFSAKIAFAIQDSLRLTAVLQNLNQITIDRYLARQERIKGSK